MPSIVQTEETLMFKFVKLDSRIGLSSLILLLLSASIGPWQPALGQRSRLAYPEERGLQGTPILPAGSQTLPSGTILIVQMEKPIDSRRSRVGDRFEASVATPIIDANGRTVVPEGAIVEGHITTVQPARWRSRSGLIGVSFDTLLLDGKRIPLPGSLEPMDDRTRKQLDMEGNIRGGNALKRNFLFIGGGAGGGAVVGAVTGAGVLAATGIGAAVGVTASLLMKGDEAVVKRGQRFGMRLDRSIYLPNPYRNVGSPMVPSIRSDRSDRRYQDGYPPDIPREPTRSYSGGSGNQVAVYEVRAERTTDGYLVVLIVAETPSPGWQIFTHHQLSANGSTLEVRLRGTPPSGYGGGQISHPNAPVIIVQDRGGYIGRIVVQGANGSRTVALNTSSVSYNNGGSQPDTYRPSTQIAPAPAQPQYPAPRPTVIPSRPRPMDNPSDGSSIILGNPSDGGQSSSTIPSSQNPPISVDPSAGSTAVGNTAIRVTNDLELFREDLATSLGLFRESNGSYSALGQRKPTASESKMVENLAFLIRDTSQIANSSSNAQARRSAAASLRDDYLVLNQTWSQVRSNADLNRRWIAISQGIQNLISAASR
jgi:hypothetical protein